MGPSRTLRLPPDPGELRSLEAGEELLLSGPALTMRDAALRRMEEALSRGERLPFDVGGQLVFHAGPTPAGAGRPAAAIGPTTSARMDAYLRILLDLGVPAILGKGPRSGEATALHAGRGAIYLVSVGGLGALLGGRVTGMETLAWEDLGPEAVYRVTLESLPAVVAIDGAGRDFLSGQYDLYGPGSGRGG